MTTPATEAPAAPAPGTPEYDAAMAAKFDKSQVTEGTPPADGAPAAIERPANLPEKFWDPKAADPVAAGYQKMADSYAALEAKNSGKPAAAADDGKPKVDDKAGLEIKPPAAGADGAAQSAIEAAGLNLEALSTEFQTDGALKPESYAAFEKIGLPKQYVDNYIAGMQALASQFEAKAHDAAGGKENYSKMSAWAAANLQPADLEAYNGAVNGTEAQMQMAVSSLRSKYEAANGAAPKLLSGGDGAISEGFKSLAEQTAAINFKDTNGNKLYDKDPAYRKKVSDRIAASTF